MAFLFGKNKKKKEDADAPVSMDKTTDIVDTSETQRTIAANRTVRQEIEQRFRELKDPDVYRTIKKAAEKNQEMLDKHAQAHQYDDSESENYSEFAELEKSLYIVTGGYREAPSENNNVPRANLDYYTKAITVLEAKFRSTSSANAVESGADQLEVFIVGFLGNLRSALERGYALKANAAIDMIKYVFVVGHRYEDYANEEERAKGIQKKVDFLDRVGKGLINAIDELYEEVQKYKTREGAYGESLKKLVKQRETYDQTCPHEVQELLNTLGFKNAMAQLPPGDERRQYLDMMLNQQSSLVTVLENSMMLEAEMRDIVGLKNGIDTMVFEVRQAFDSSGKEFNFNEHMKLLEEIHAKNIKEMNEANKRANSRANAEEALMGRLEAVANSPKLGENVNAAAIALRNYEDLTKQNEALTENRERRRAEYEVEKKKLELEREKRRVQEREQYINEIKRMEEEIQKIREEANTVTEQSVTADNDNYAVNTEQAVDNRTLITEEN